MVALSACSVAAPVTRGNEQVHTSTIAYYNRMLDVSMRLNGDYDLVLRPHNRPDSFTKAQLRTLGVSRRQATVALTGKTHIAPTYLLRMLVLSSSPDWKAQGFTPVADGRFQRSTTQGPTLVREYVLPYPAQSGWLYVLATGAGTDEPEVTIQERNANMDTEYNSYIFPSIRQGRQP